MKISINCREEQEAVVQCFEESSVCRQCKHLEGLFEYKENFLNLLFAGCMPTLYDELHNDIPDDETLSWKYQECQSSMPHEEMCEKENDLVCRAFDPDRNGELSCCCAEESKAYLLCEKMKWGSRCEHIGCDLDKNDSMIKNDSRRIYLTAGIITGIVISVFLWGLVFAWKRCRNREPKLSYSSSAYMELSESLGRVSTV